MRIFKDVRLVEHIGSGIPRILKKYDRSAFNFSTNFLRITYPYRKVLLNEMCRMKISGSRQVFTGNSRRQIGDNELELHIFMDYLKTHDSITSTEAMEVLNPKAFQTRQILREMAERNLLEAQGEN